jgi:hypothetical protein
VGHRDVGPLEVRPRIGRTGDDETVVVGDLADGPSLELGLALGWRTIKELGALPASPPLLDDQGLIMVDPKDSLAPMQLVD